MTIETTAQARPATAPADRLRDLTGVWQDTGLSPAAAGGSRPAARLNTIVNVTEGTQ